jgi:hypothetical protein
MPIEAALQLNEFLAGCGTEATIIREAVAFPRLIRRLRRFRRQANEY